MYIEDTDLNVILTMRDHDVTVFDITVSVIVHYSYALVKKTK